MMFPGGLWMVLDIVWWVLDGSLARRLHNRYAANNVLSYHRVSQAMYPKTQLESASRSERVGRTPRKCRRGGEFRHFCSPKFSPRKFSPPETPPPCTSDPHAWQGRPHLTNSRRVLLATTAPIMDIATRLWSPRSLKLYVGSWAMNALPTCSIQRSSLRAVTVLTSSLWLTSSHLTESNASAFK